jgi:hypothetical protein
VCVCEYVCVCVGGGAGEGLKIMGRGVREEGGLLRNRSRTIRNMSGASLKVFDRIKKKNQIRKR